MNNVVPMARRPTGEDGGGNGHGQRLRTLEIEVAKIATKMESVATREEVLKLKLWILGGVIGGMVVAATLGFAIARLFLAS